MEEHEGYSVNSKAFRDPGSQSSIISNFDVQIYADTLPILSFVVNSICCTKSLLSLLDTGLGH